MSVKVGVNREMLSVPQWLTTNVPILSVFKQMFNLDVCTMVTMHAVVSHVSTMLCFCSIVDFKEPQLIKALFPIPLHSSPCWPMLVHYALLYFAMLLIDHGISIYKAANSIIRFLYFTSFNEYMRHAFSQLFSSSLRLSQTLRCSLDSCTRSPF